MKNVISEITMKELEQTIYRALQKASPKPWLISYWKWMMLLLKHEIRVDLSCKINDLYHLIHKGKLPFWEEFEYFLMDSFEYDPTYHQLVINGDGANWITTCREYFQPNAIFTIDRFHVYQDLRLILRGHPRYKNITRIV